jgi:hypothetical protein
LIQARTASRRQRKKPAGRTRPAGDIYLLNPKFTSALAQTAPAFVPHAIAMRIGRGGRHRSENAGGPGDQRRHNNKALHLSFPSGISRASGGDAAIDSIRLARNCDTNGQADHAGGWSGRHPLNRGILPGSGQKRGDGWI